MEPSGYFAWMQQWIIKGLIATYELNSNAATLTAITTAAGYIKDVANTVNNPSTTPSQTSGMRGVYYGTNYTTSSGVTRVTTATGTADALGDNTIQYGVGSRTVAEPSLYVLGWMYQRTGTTAWKTLGDELFAAAFCYSGTGTACDAGSGNFDDIKRLSGDPATSLASAQGKEHGLAYGAGMPGRYLALRITPTVTPTIPIRFSGNVSTGGNIRVQ